MYLEPHESCFHCIADESLELVGLVVVAKKKIGLEMLGNEVGKMLDFEKSLDMLMMMI